MKKNNLHCDETIQRHKIVKNDFSEYKGALSINSITFLLVVLLLILSSLSSPAAAESIFGFPGLVSIPTAQFYRDGVVTGGVNYISKERLSYSNYQYDGLVTYTTLSFLPFLEFNLKFTKQLGRPASSGHTIDRSPSIRLKLLNERRNTPSVVFGVHDVLSTVNNGKARHFGATYIVATKHFMIDKFMIVPSLGYGFDTLDGREKDLVGLFGGAKIRHARLRPVSFLFDYDTQYINVGLDVFPTRFACIKVGLTNFQYFIAGASMQFNLFDVF